MQSININRPVTQIANTSSRESLLKGVNLLADTVKSTLGVSGNTVLIEDKGGNPHATKDGVTVAKSIFLKEKVQNMGAMTIRQAAMRTAEEAGDGTTTSTVIAQAICNSEIPENIPYMEFRRGMDDAVRDVTVKLEEGKKRLLKKDIINVATISANNDEGLGRVIAEGFEKAGKNGMVIMDESPDESTYIESVEGMELDKGYISPIFVTDRKRGRVAYNNPVVLISDNKVDIMNQIDFALGVAVNSKRPIVIIAEVSEEVRNALAVNKVQGNLQVVVIDPPSFGNKRRDILEDLGVACGCDIIKDETGDNWENLDHENLGVLESIIVENNKTVMMTHPDMKDGINDQVRLLKDMMKSASKQQKAWLEARLANISASVSIVRVGGHTDIERKELKDRVDDAIHAVRAALEDGVVIGGGLALLRASLLNIPEGSDVYQTGYETVLMACAVPFETIVINALTKSELSSVYEEVLACGETEGYDLLGGEVVDFFEKGILDPIKVVKCALENAVSAAYNILSTKNVITLQ